MGKAPGQHPLHCAHPLLPGSLTSWVSHVRSAEECLEMDTDLPMQGDRRLQLAYCKDRPGGSGRAGIGLGTTWVLRMVHIRPIAWSDRSSEPPGWELPSHACARSSTCRARESGSRFIQRVQSVKGARKPSSGSGPRHYWPYHATPGSSGPGMRATNKRWLQGQGPGSPRWGRLEAGFPALLCSVVFISPLSRPAETPLPLLSRSCRALWREMFPPSTHM